VLRNEQAGAADAEPLLTVRDVALRRSFGVSTATVYKLCASNQLEHVRILNVIRISTQALSDVKVRLPASAIRSDPSFTSSG
jgi:hypothetical protein